MKTRNRVILIIGILIIIIGVGIFLYPVILQARTAYTQKKMMEEFKQQVLDNMADINSETATSSPAEVTPAEPNPDINDFLVSDLDELPEESDSSTENSDETINASRLRGQQCIGIVTIEKIDLVYAIVEGTTDDNIGVAIGHFTESVGIGQEGNCALAGHRGGKYGRYFGDINQLESGDKVVLTDLNGDEYTYVVYDSFIVEPTDTYVVKELDEEGKILTMVTCTKGGKQRLIVRAKCTTEAVSMKRDR